VNVASDNIAASTPENNRITSDTIIQQKGKSQISFSTLSNEAKSQAKNPERKIIKHA